MADKEMARRSSACRRAGHPRVRRDAESIHQRDFEGGCAVMSACVALMFGLPLLMEVML